MLYDICVKQVFEVNTVIYSIRDGRQKRLSLILCNISDLKSYLVNTYNGLLNIHDIASGFMNDKCFICLKIPVTLCR